MIATYEVSFPQLEGALTEATVNKAQVVYKKVTEGIVEPWHTAIKRWPQGRPPYWSQYLEEVTKMGRKLYRESNKYR